MPRSRGCVAIVILRPKPKNLSLIPHRFYEVLDGVYPEPKPRPFAEFILSDAKRFFAALRMTESEGLRVTHCEGFRMTNSHFK
ncbi:MAG TPA: hypothetical protein VJZ24_05140 [Thermodesulfovibrionales bacterium]|nr:hypothetical protein [Thermodesulfovibrionales bacterium]